MYSRKLLHETPVHGGWVVHEEGFQHGKPEQRSRLYFFCEVICGRDVQSLILDSRGTLRRVLFAGSGPSQTPQLAHLQLEIHASLVIVAEQGCRATRERELLLSTWRDVCRQLIDRWHVGVLASEPEALRVLKSEPRVGVAQCRMSLQDHLCLSVKCTPQPLRRVLLPGLMRPTMAATLTLCRVMHNHHVRGRGDAASVD